jgi:hypothetical protein
MTIRIKSIQDVLNDMDQQLGPIYGFQSFSKFAAAVVEVGVTIENVVDLYHESGTLEAANVLQHVAASNGIYVDVIEKFPHLFEDEIVRNSKGLDTRKLLVHDDEFGDVQELVLSMISRLPGEEGDVLVEHFWTMGGTENEEPEDERAAKLFRRALWELKPLASHFGLDRHIQD